MTNLSTQHRNLILLATGFAATYLFLPFAEGSIFNIVQKSSTCVVLGFVAYWAVEDPKIKKLALAALLFSSLGDAFLAVRSSDLFTFGLGSFLIAHLIYILIFVRAKNWEPLPRLKQVGVGIIILVALGMLALLWPALGALKAPVAIYVTAIAAMTISAMYSRYAPALAITGAASFMISDGTIAINKFLLPFELASPLIWITYILAQVLLTLAIIQGAGKKNTGE